MTLLLLQVHMQWMHRAVCAGLHNAEEYSAGAVLVAWLC